MTNLKIVPTHTPFDLIDLNLTNQSLINKSATERVEFALRNLPGAYALSSSFGAQSAVSLHLLTRVYPDIPVIIADTGYLFPETYQFIDELQEKLSLNLKVYRSHESPAWQEARYGKLWEKDQTSMDEYNRRNKVEPIDRAMHELNTQTWFSGIRSDQSESRKKTPVIQKFKGRFKVHPIIDWNSKKIHDYLIKHDLPYHPLWEKGYVSIGDTHSTKSLAEAGDETDVRFAGMNRECGLHVE